MTAPTFNNLVTILTGWGFAPRHASLHFQRRCGRLKERVWHAAWPKLTAVFNATTHLITGSVEGHGPSQDSPQFEPAMRQAAANLKPTRALADKGFDAEHNHALCREELGAAKHRMNQTCSAMGLVQLKHYPQRTATIHAAIDRFWSLLEDVPGPKPHRIEDVDSHMDGWYFARGLYDPEALGGLPVDRFCEAVRAEGVACHSGLNAPLHTHAFFHEADIFQQSQPTAAAFGQDDTRQGSGSMPVTEGLANRVVSSPWFKHDDAAWIERYASAYRKVARNASQLLETP